MIKSKDYWQQCSGGTSETFVKSFIKTEVYNVNRLLLLILTLMISIIPAMATDYYVDVDGVHGSSCSDSNPGTSWSSPFCSIQKAADVVTAGSVVTVANGTYIDADIDGNIIELIESGISSNWITFKSENKWGAILDSQNAHFMTDIFISNINYVRFEDFEVKGGGIGVYGYSHDIYFYRLYIHHVGQFACPTDNQIDYDANKYGAYFYHANPHCGIYTDDGTYNITSDSVLMHNIGRLPCSWMQWSDWVQDHGYYTAGTNNSIINNIFYSIEAGWPIHITEGNGWVVSGNTFQGKHNYATGRILLVNQLGDIINTKIQNNIVYYPWSGGYYPIPAIVELQLYGTAYNIEIKNNLGFNPDGTIDEIYLKYGNTGMYNASNNTINQDPLFVNVTTKDFHLQSSSPAINNGTSSGAPLYDFDGNLRGSPHDIGAYEYVSGGVLPPTIPSPITIPPSITTSQILSSIWSWLISIFGA